MDVMSVGKLIRKGDGPQEVERMMNTMIKYGANLREPNIRYDGVLCRQHVIFKKIQI
jgi:hypothetical protein